MTTVTIEPIRTQTTLDTPPATAFEIFTSGMATWWNRDYTIGAEPLAGVVVEQEAGGRWYERGENGAECAWGRVVVWEPPSRVVLEWQITADWQHDPDLHTELDVSFVADGGGTRVGLEHRGLDAYGAQAAMMREIFDGPTGWAGLLEAFRTTASA